MSADVTITLSPEAQAILRNAAAWPVNLVRAAAKALDKQNELTVGDIQKRKLSRRGPTTLGVVTDRLRLSIRPEVAVINGGVIESSIGSNVSYAGVHEFGFDGMVKVKAFTRHQVSNDVLRGASSARGFSKRLKNQKLTASGIARVREHQRHVKFPARAFIRTTLAEDAPQYSAALSQAVISSFHGATP